MKLFLQRTLAAALIALVFAGPYAGKVLADWSWGDAGGGSYDSNGWFSYMGWG